MLSVSKALVSALVLLLVDFATATLREGVLPAYHYGASIPVSCMNRSMYVIPIGSMFPVATH